LRELKSAISLDRTQMGLSREDSRKQEDDE
jgi:hypothetical protein